MCANRHQTESYGYGPYGEYQYGSGGGTDLIHWRYTGEWLDGDTVVGNGYYKIGLRYYDQHQARWTQTDPAERVTNPMQPAEAQPYNYAGCNPTNQTDPTGACSTGLSLASLVTGYAALKMSFAAWGYGKLSLPAGATAIGVSSGGLAVVLSAVAIGLSVGALICAASDD